MKGGKRGGEKRRGDGGGRDVKGKKGEGDRKRGSAALDKVHRQMSSAPASPPPGAATFLFTERTSTKSAFT